MWPPSAARVTAAFDAIGTLRFEPIREEPGGELLSMVTDPNGVVYELVEWLPQTVVATR